VVIYAKLSRLGRKIIATATAVEVSGAQNLSQQRMSVDQVEDLEAVASRMARAIVEGRSTEDVAELGNVTRSETKPARRRKGQSGLILKVGGVSPMGDLYRAGFGILLDVGYWYEARDFAIHPSLNYRGNAKNREGESYNQVNLDIAANYILARSDFAPFIAVGGGLRHIEEERQLEAIQGTVMVLDSSGPRKESTWAPGAFVRAGLLLFRTYTMRMALSADYDLSFASLHGHTNPQAFNFGISVIF